MNADDRIALMIGRFVMQIEQQGDLIRKLQAEIGALKAAAEPQAPPATDKAQG